MQGLSHGRTTLLVLALVAAACGGQVPAPSPTPRCWVGVHAEYTATSDDGSMPTETAMEDAARIIEERLSRVGYAIFEVRIRPDQVIEVDLTSAPEESRVRELIPAVGAISFVAVPADDAVARGDDLPDGLVPILDRGHVATVTRGATRAGGAAVELTLTDEGGQLLDEWAAGNVGRQLAIAVDDQVLIAPTIMEGAFDGRVQISGLSELEISYLLTLLQLPRMPLALEEAAFSEVDPPAGC